RNSGTPPCPVPELRPHFPNTGRTGDNHAAGHAGEDPRIDDARHRLQLLLEGGRIVYRPMIPIENEIAIIGNEWPAAFLSHLRITELKKKTRNSKRNYFNGNGRFRTKPLDNLAFIDDDHQPLRSMRDDLLSD